MGNKTLSTLVLAAFLITACTLQPARYQASLENEGEIYLYLQPMPQAAHRVNFSITHVFAVRHDGSIIRLEQSFSQLKGKALLSAQRRLASSSLPPGLYKGISLQIDSASLLGEEGLTTLLIPKTSLVIEREFTIVRKTATALFVSLQEDNLISIN